MSPKNLSKKPLIISGILLIIFWVSFLSAAEIRKSKTPPLTPPSSEETVVLSPEAQDLAHFDCLSQRACQRNFLPSSRACSGVDPTKFDCYLCEPEPDILKKVSCPKGWNASPLNTTGYACRTSCNQECLRSFQERKSEDSREYFECINQCPETSLEETTCPEGFTLGATLRGFYYCLFDNLEALTPSTPSHNSLCKTCGYNQIGNDRCVKEITTTPTLMFLNK